MSLVLCFVDESNNIREDFVKFIHCNEGLSGEALASVVLNAVTKDFKLNIINCYDHQGYDGAGAVAGYRNGLSTRILELNQKALYVHCHSHRHNLCVFSSCEVPPVRNVMDQMKDISYFFNFSETKQLSFMRNILEHAPEIIDLM